jgi:hypothetical protein
VRESSVAWDSGHNLMFTLPYVALGTFLWVSGKLAGTSRLEGHGQNLAGQIYFALCMFTVFVVGPCQSRDRPVPAS